MRKLMVLVFLGFMCFGLVGCGSGSGPAQPDGGGAAGAGGGAVGSGTGGGAGGAGGSGAGGAAGSAGGTGAADGGVETAVSTCIEAVGILCEKLFQCPNPSAAGVGATVDECKDQMGPGSLCMPENADCLAGQTFHPDKGRACVEAYKTTTCDDLASTDFASIRPSVCDLQCTSS